MDSGNMENYIRNARIPHSDAYDMRVKELTELYEVYQSCGLYKAFILAFRFGQAKGYKMAKRGKTH